MYFSLFCGRPDALAHSGLRLRLKMREACTFAVLVVVLVGFGIVPRPLVDSRVLASKEILKLRQLRMPDRQNLSKVRPPLYAPANRVH
jgi:NADH:ubiquinone oxidoreductase subunit 4 (subunit M)